MKNIISLLLNAKFIFIFPFTSITKFISYISQLLNIINYTFELSNYTSHIA